MAAILKTNPPVRKAGFSVFWDSWATTIVNPPPVIAGLGGDL